jgi:hypothetical protein
LDDRAEADAEQLVGLLFVAAEPLKRAEITENLRTSPARLARACTVLQMDPPRGLRRARHGRSADPGVGARVRGQYRALREWQMANGSSSPHPIRLVWPN